MFNAEKARANVSMYQVRLKRETEKFKEQMLDSIEENSKKGYSSYTSCSLLYDANDRITYKNLVDAFKPLYPQHIDNYINYFTALGFKVEVRRYQTSEFINLEISW